MYLALAKNTQDIQAAHLALLAYQIEGKLIEDIRARLNRGMVIGGDKA